VGESIATSPLDGYKLYLAECWSYAATVFAFC
jgi:hypothetical protein